MDGLEKWFHTVVIFFVNFSFNPLRGGGNTLRYHRITSGSTLRDDLICTF